MGEVIVVTSGKGGKNGKGGVKEEEVDIIAGEDESEDSYPLLEGGSWADIEALLRDTLVEELPLQPLCKPDCLRYRFERGTGPSS